MIVERIRAFSKHEAIALLAIFSIVIHFVLMGFSSPYSQYPLYCALLVGGGPLVFDLLCQFINLQFKSDLLAGLSIVTSLFLEQYLAGSLVVLMLSGGKAIEGYAIKTASKVLAALASRAPTLAHRRKGDSLEDITIDQIAIGDILQVFPHEICPVDGIVLIGNGAMDESYLTGEPFVIAKAPGSSVLSGSVNGAASLTIQAEKLATDSRYAKIMQVMRESEQKRPQLRRIADQLGAWYTPLALTIAALSWILSGESIRFLAVLIIATPCPLLIAIPVAIIGSISLCASRGILIKNPVVLEQLDQCKTMIFDKTGTLTYGKPTLTEIKIYGPYEESKLLKLVASIEKYSKHPLASAILEKAQKENIALVDAKQINEPQGKGLVGKIDGQEILITSRKHLNAKTNAALLPHAGGLECIILINGELAAHFHFRDSPRSDSTSFVSHLQPKHGFKKLMIISGDRDEEVRYLAHSIGISEVYSEKSPEEKVALVIQETKKAKTVYLGDGINDAPALVVATVGIAFGKNSDITAEAAGAVIMDNTLERVDEFLHISSRMRRICLQSAVGGMLLSLIGMGIAAFGYLPPVAGAITQEIIDIFAILNSLRTIWQPALLSDMLPKDK